MTTTTLTPNGLPVEAQPWARGVEQFMRDEETLRQMAADNSESAMVAAGNAVTAAANNAAAQLAAQAEMRRIPQTLNTAHITVATSAYFDASGAPYGRLSVSIVPSDLDTDGNPLIPVRYQVWGRVYWPDASLAADDKTTMGNGPVYQLLGSSTSTNVQVDTLQCGVEYQLRFVALSSFGVSSAYSDYVLATPPATLDAMTVPTAPMLSSAAGILVAQWNGLFGASQPPSQFRYVFAEVSPHDANTFVRAGGELVRGGGSIQISGLTVDDEYDVEFFAVDSLGAVTAASDISTITIAGVSTTDLDPALVTLIDSSTGNSITLATTAPSDDGLAAGDAWYQRNDSGAIIAQWMWDGTSWSQQTLSHEMISSIDLGTATVGTLNGALITARTLRANALEAGSITVNELSPTIGDDLQLAAKGSVDIIAGQVADLSSAQDDLSDSLAVTQTSFAVKPDGAHVSSPGTNTEFVINSDGAQILENGAVVSYWNSGQMFVESFVGTDVILSNHKLEKDGVHTLVRAL